jgi:hypothetical protein
MNVDRRVFVAGAALAAFTPALRILPSEAAAPVAAAVAQPTILISGWSVVDASLDDQIWINVGHGWKTAWR